MSSLLVVDDEPGIRESLEYYFSSQGHQTQTASSLSEALDLAEKTKPDAIVSDLMFESGTGLMLHKELSRRHKGYDPGFILMSGKATLESAIEAVKQGVDQFLLKPLKLPELQSALDAALLRRHKAQQNIKIKFELAEHFYHDLSLPLNQLLPRLCMLLEGRFGSLSMAQLQCLSGQFEYLRQILWLMKGFYPRLLENQGSDLKRSSLDVNRLVSDTLSKIENDLYQREISLEIKVNPEPRVIANRDAAQTLIEIVAVRALAMAEKGSRLILSWGTEGTLAVLKFELIARNGSLHVLTMAPLIQLVPLSLNCLEAAGLSFDSESPAGPWRISFNVEKDA